MKNPHAVFNMKHSTYGLKEKAVTSSTLLDRHLLALTQHFVQRYNEKMRGLEERQPYINIEVNKITETVAQVEKMQKPPSVKSIELRTNCKTSQRQRKNRPALFLHPVGA